MVSVFKRISTIAELPVLNKLAPAANRTPNAEEKQGYLRSQRLALNCAKEIALMVEPGWTEKHAAQLMETYLRDHGVEGFFHFPFVWWGDRAKFVGVNHYYDYLPSNRVLQEGESFILDVAPILDGYISDIGYAHSPENPENEWTQAREFLVELRNMIPRLFESQESGAKIWYLIDQEIAERGYENIHEKYPFSVLGHRVHRTTGKLGQLKFVNFGWQSYWNFSARGILGQLLNKNFEGDLTGLWAIEPHIAIGDRGLKFEEILVVEDNKAYWLEEDFKNEGW